MKKIVIIGPVYPYKGGIAHYTGLLYRALAKHYNTIMVSYKMQYPKFLFKKEQRDYSNDRFKIDDARFLLNTANPFNIVVTAVKINQMHPDMVIIQWWHPYFAPCYWILTKLLRHTRIVFICHNVFPHERFPMDRFLTKMVLKQGDSFVLHSRSDAEDLKRIKADAKYKVTVHPTYNIFKVTDMSRERARGLLDLEMSQKVLLFFGFVRPYKGLKYLLQAMPGIIAKMPETVLLVVGEFGKDRDEYREMMEENHLGNYIRCYEGYIPDTEVERYFAASDVVVLPYESATQSGIVQIAYGFEKPVIATNVGGLPDVVKDKKTGLLVDPFDSEKLCHAVVEFFSCYEDAAFVENIRKESYRYSWDRMRETIDNLFHEIDR